MPSWPGAQGFKLTFPLFLPNEQHWVPAGWFRFLSCFPSVYRWAFSVPCSCVGPLYTMFLCHLLCATLGSLYPCSHLSSFALAVPHFEGAFLAAGCLQIAKLVHLVFTHSPHVRVTYAVCFAWAAEAKCWWHPLPLEEPCLGCIQSKDKSFGVGTLLRLYTGDVSQ